MSKLGENIRRYRESKRLNQSDLARKIGRQPNLISRYESGEVPNPGSEVIADIAKALGVTPSELLGEEITSREVIDWIKSHDLTDDEKALIEAYRGMERLSRLGVLAFLADSPDHWARFEEAVRSTTEAEHQKLQRLIDRARKVPDVDP